MIFLLNDFRYLLTPGFGGTKIHIPFVGGFDMIFGCILEIDGTKGYSIDPFVLQRE